MNGLKAIIRRINVNFAFAQGTYWMGYCAYACFATVFLTGRGLSDTQIGTVISSAAVGSILLQTLLSSFCDKHPAIPLKKIGSILLSIVIGIAAILYIVPASVSLVMALYIVGYACAASLNGFLNSIMMQHNNLGLPVNFGIPRGVGSISYAVTSFALGMVVEHTSPEITMPFTVVLCAAAVLSIALMPRPDRVSVQYQLSPAASPAEKPCSTFQMLRRNPLLVLLLLAIIFAFTGQSVLMSFLIRAIENVGGSAADLGTCFLLSAGLELPAMLLSRPLLKKFGSKRLLTVSFLAFFLKSLALALAPSIGFIYASNVFCIFAMGLFGFASVYFINSIVASTEKVRGQSLASLCGSGGIGTVIGALLGGMIMDSLGITALLFICAGFSLIGFLFALLVSRLHTRQSRAFAAASSGEAIPPVNHAEFYENNY